MHLIIVIIHDRMSINYIQRQTMICFLFFSINKNCYWFDVYTLE